MACTTKRGRSFPEKMQHREPAPGTQIQGQGTAALGGGSVCFHVACATEWTFPPPFPPRKCSPHRPATQIQAGGLQLRGGSVCFHMACTTKGGRSFLEKMQHREPAPTRPANPGTQIQGQGLQLSGAEQMFSRGLHEKGWTFNPKKMQRPRPIPQRPGSSPNTQEPTHPPSETAALMRAAGKVLRPGPREARTSHSAVVSPWTKPAQEKQTLDPDLYRI